MNVLKKLLIKLEHTYTSTGTIVEKPGDDNMGIVTIPGSEDSEIWWYDMPKAVNDNITRNHISGQKDRIIKDIDKKIRNGLLKENFTILDLCSGPGELLREISNKWNKCKPYGNDIFTSEFNDFSLNKKTKIKIYKFPFQELFKHKLNKKIDIITMFNSYRALPEEVKNSIDDWCSNNCKYFIYDKYNVITIKDYTK